MNLDNLPILSILIWLPILGGVWSLIIGDQEERVVKRYSFLISFVTFLLSVLLYYQFDNSFSGMQFIEELYWIESFSIKYHLGVDGIEGFDVWTTAKDLAGRTRGRLAEIRNGVERKRVAHARTHDEGRTIEKPGGSAEICRIPHLGAQKLRKSSDPSVLQGRTPGKTRGRRKAVIPGIAAQRKTYKARRLCAPLHFS